ncbi:hypothetical protein WS66_22175 [Burkholderia sp. LA-2-3-30-S1-D2]|nr:hypothetical protein WS66_22175 [Burkholderia sp. LA-2-3-30-S1-D2]KVE12579.1 hypothetical protein WS66_16390 [Burkholderia sp. LA-2-3-30-S1-D2]
MYITEMFTMVHLLQLPAQQAGQLLQELLQVTLVSIRSTKGNLPMSFLPVSLSAEVDAPLGRA